MYRVIKHKNQEYSIGLVNDVDSAYEIESAGYPESEAATHAKLLERSIEARHLFYGIFENGKIEPDQKKLIGFVSATQYEATSLTSESMEVHMPEGSLVCIHSVAIDLAYQRQGFATLLVNQFIQYLKETQDEHKGKEIRLIAHEYLIKFYQNAGFELIGQSKVSHGPDPWFELKLQL